MLKIIPILASLLAVNSFCEDVIHHSIEREVISYPLNIIDAKTPISYLKSNVIYLADQLQRNLDKSYLDTPVIVTSFLNLDDLRRSSPLGRFISEALMSELQVRKFKVIDARVVKNILIDSNGEYALSRNLEHIRDNFKASAISTGTYTFSDFFIIINAKIIDLKSGVVTSSAQTQVPINGLEEMLFDYSKPQKVSISNVAKPIASIKKEREEVKKIRDDDLDGVENLLDECPDTPKGFRVDDYGCKVSFLFDVKFEFNSFKLTKESLNSIKEFAKFLDKNSKYSAEIQGHTDDVGSESYNRALSEKRAKSVYEELIELGVSKNILKYRGYGESEPIATNLTSKGRASNRRVEAKLSF